MKKTLAIALGAALASVTTFAADFGHTQDLTIYGKAAPLAETSARILANEKLEAPELVEDITDGLGSEKIPGYKMMIMARTHSVAAETREPKEGQSKWRDTTYVHRGIKLFLGIPVTDGKMDVANIKLIKIGVVDDDGGAAPHSKDEKIRPVGKQLMDEKATVENAKLAISELELPNMAKGESSGGGVKLEASATINGKPVEAKIDSTFTRFLRAKPTSNEPFKADARFVK